MSPEMIQEKEITLLDAYFAADLSSVEMAKVERRCAIDPEFQSAFKEMESLYRLAKREENMEFVRSLEAEFPRVSGRTETVRTDYRWAVAAGIALFIALGLIMTGDAIKNGIEYITGNKDSLEIKHPGNIPGKYEDHNLAIFPIDSYIRKPDPLPNNPPLALDSPRLAPPNRIRPYLENDSRYVNYNPDLQPQTNRNWEWEKTFNSSSVDSWLKDRGIPISDSVPANILRRVVKARIVGGLQVRKVDEPVKVTQIVRMLIFEDPNLLQPRYHFEDDLLLFLGNNSESINLSGIQVFNASAGPRKQFYLKMEGTLYRITEASEESGLQKLEEASDQGMIEKLKRY